MCLITIDLSETRKICKIRLFLGLSNDDISHSNVNLSCLINFLIIQTLQGHNLR
jgi:hypothetical protein